MLHMITAMTQAQLGNRAAARAEVQRTLQVCPEFEKFFGRGHLQKWFPNQSDLVEHVLEGVRLAGFRLLEEESRTATARPDTLSPVALRAELTGPGPDWSASPPIFPVKRHSVGRQKELAELGRAFESAAAGQGLFLCVTGEPGIGKTTLVEDFLSELAATGRPCALARGRCSERLAGTEAYLPFLEALESLLHGDGGEAAARVMKATAPNWYAQVAPPAAEDSSLARVLAESKAATQERLKRELGAFLQELSHLRPLLLFFDDLHWADASTVDLLAYLGGKCAGMRALLVFTYRPTDLVVGKHPFGPVKLDLQAHGVCRELALEFLTRPDLDRYLALEFPEHCFPEEFAALVHARTEGSPLFMADLLRYLRDRQVLTLEQGRWTLRESVPDLQRDLARIGPRYDPAEDRSTRRRRPPLAGGGQRAGLRVRLRGRGPGSRAGSGGGGGAAGRAGPRPCLRADGAGAGVPRPDADAAIPLRPRALSKRPIRVAATDAACVAQRGDGAGAARTLRG